MFAVNRVFRAFVSFGSPVDLHVQQLIADATYQGVGLGSIVVQVNCRWLKRLAWAWERMGCGRMGCGKMGEERDGLWMDGWWKDGWWKDGWWKDGSV